MVTTTTANAKALVFLTSEMVINGDNNIVGRISFEVTGPVGFTTIVPADARSFTGSAIDDSSGLPRVRGTAVVLVTLGDPGVYTFTAKYRTQFTANDSGKVVTFSNRDIVVSVSP
jgi:hypothetical protein